MTRAALGLGLTAAVILALGLRVGRAEHEVFYRYTVLGYVTDARGRALPDRGIELVRDKTGLVYAGATDEAGLYLIVARLGDESLGETLTLRTGRARLRLTVRFDPANHADERGTRVDLEGARWAERVAWFRSTLVNILGPGH